MGANFQLKTGVTNHFVRSWNLELVEIFFPSEKSEAMFNLQPASNVAHAKGTASLESHYLRAPCYLSFFLK